MLSAVFSVAAISFAVNGLLLFGTGLLFGEAAKCWRLLTAAGLGAGFAGLCLVPGFGFLGGLHWHVVSLVLMAIVAFGVCAKGWKRGSAFLLQMLALDGMARNQGPWAILLAVGIWGLSKYALGCSPEHLVPVEIGTVHLTALRDTGNGLRDPITGEGVLVVGGEAARSLSGLTKAQMEKPLDTMASAKRAGLRLIPYKSVGKENGMLLAMRFPRVRVGTREGPGIVAFAPSGLEGEAYQALAGGLL